ncbi:MAG: hypothetical protein KatS3mg027_2711 [Bacteroidia bacterium]|nr:MAG: hypothetical protein KatS3mg027_2711 [Bacteroidia bacterium]
MSLPIPVNIAQSKNTTKPSVYTMGKKHYETTDWLGNVRVTYTDKKSWNNGKFALNVSSSQDYYPFGSVMEGRNLEITNYRFGFGGHEKDNEVKGCGNHLSFGDMGYDPRISRRWRIDPFEILYVPISSYVFSLNNPVMLTDQDGNIIVGSDGKPVTYERGENGIIKWSENATADIIEVGNAMLSTEFGEKAFNKWQNASTKITITIDKNSSSDILGETKPTVDANGKYKVNEDGQYEEAEIIIYKKKIDEDRAEGSGKRFEGASYEETLGAVGTHEVYHNEPEQVKLDRKQPNEMQQKPSKNLPINSEINFREEYHKNNPGLPNEKTWKQYYEKYGYEGIEEK